jgi:hypothetical protein
MTIKIVPPAKAFLIVCVFAVAFIATGCPDADKRADAAFKKKGLSRIRTVRDGIDAGAVILVKNGKANYADNILDYATDGSTAKLAISENPSVISKFDTDTSMDASTALGFVSEFLPIKAEGKIGLTGNVQIGQINAAVRRAKIPDLRKYLGTAAAADFKAQMMENIADGYSVFIAYEAYRAKSIKFKSKAGTDLAVGATIGKLNVIDAANPKFGWKKVTSTELDVTGDTFYAFGLRTAKIEFTGGVPRILLSEFVPTGTLSAGTESGYSWSPIGERNSFEPLEIDFNTSLRRKK